MIDCHDMNQQSVMLYYVKRVCIVVRALPYPSATFAYDHAMMRRRRGVMFGRGDDTVGNPHRAQITQFKLLELIL